MAGTDSSHPAPAVNDECCAEVNEGNGVVVQGSPTGEPDPLAAAAAVVALVLGSAYPSMHNNSPFTNNCGVLSEVGAQTSTTHGTASTSLPSSHAHYDPHTGYNPHDHPFHHIRAAAPHAVNLQQPAQADDDDFLVDGHFEKRRLTPTEEQTANDICGTPYTLERGITLPLRVQADYADQEMWTAAGLDTTGIVLGARESDTDSPYSSQASRGSAAAMYDVPLNVEAVALPQVSEVQSASVYTSLPSSRTSSTGVTQDLLAPQLGPSAEVVPSPKDGDERDPPSHTPDVAGGFAIFPVVPEEDGGESEPLSHVLATAPSDFESEPVTANTSPQALVKTNEPSFTNSSLGDESSENQNFVAAYPPSYSPGGPGDTIVFEPSSTAQVMPASSSQSMSASQETAPLMRTRSRKRARDIDENSSSPVRVPETKSPLPSSRRPRKLQRTSSRPFSQKQVENKESQSSLFGRNTPSQELSFD